MTLALARTVAGVARALLTLGAWRLQLIGALPAEFQSYLFYTAARLTSAHSPEVAGEFIDFLSSPQARKEFIASGAE